ncbi:MAG: DNA adenine methylase [Deltaproteobacteria bacterium]|nr:DNA adenine methylase [Deltaproteobacteria bacterium]
MKNNVITKQGTTVSPIVISESNCRPFVKWAGGKNQLLPALLERVPKNFSIYFEPFLGGGALFFALCPEEACLSDINEDLINAYQVVRSRVTSLIKDLRKHVYERDYYYETREVDRDPNFKKWGKTRKASRLIYLNKTCYNGLYRVNSKGQFNTPFGRYNNPKILDESNLRACSRALKGAQILLCSFEQIQKEISARDFVYLDPPYAPLSNTAYFTSYTKDGFDSQMQIKLRDFCRRLDKKGAQFMVSNSATDFILRLYREFKIEYVEATRAINSKGHKRGKMYEIIVTNY